MMAVEEPEEELKPCPLCGVSVPARRLHTCAICKAVHCEFCAKVDFGRTFCSARCRDFFFWGDGEEEEKDF